MSRSSKRKPKRRTFFDERDSENDENYNNIDELGFNKGKEGNYDKEDDREQTVSCVYIMERGQRQWCH